MANAWCINAIWFDWSLIRTLENLDSSNIWVWVQFTAPNPLDDKRFDYIKYTDKCWNTCCLSWENEILIYATNWTIKNLTLTNDDANEVVNVKRTDIFWSNRKKTVVRYKTWWYPTSITDWTLAVEELVMNQYSSSWFNVEWLEDWTTYYFSAFAVAQDDTIIVVQTNSITPEFFNRQPNANTVAYYEFNWNLNDWSWNWHNLSMYTWSVSYWTESWWWKYAYFNRNSRTNYRNRNVNYKWPNTISFFFQPKENLYNSWAKDIVELWSNSSNNFLRVCDTITFSWNTMTSETMRQLTVWTRYMITIACDWNTFHFYENAVEFATASQNMSWTHNSRFRVNQVPDTNSNSYSNNMYIWRLTREEKYRDATYVARYYKKYKSLYWLS